MLSCSVDKQKAPSQQPVLEGSIVDKWVYLVNMQLLDVACLFSELICVQVRAYTQTRVALLLLLGHVLSDTRKHAVNAVAATLVCTPESDGTSHQRLVFGMMIE